MYNRYLADSLKSKITLEDCYNYYRKDKYEIIIEDGKITSFILDDYMKK